MSPESQKSTSDVAIVIPAWNEAATIVGVVKSVLPFGTVIVVDDASDDGTDRLAAKAGALVVSHESNLGYDGALNSGFAKAAELGADYIVTFDADGQHDPENLPTMIDMLRSGADIVVGTRPARARIAEMVFARVFWIFYGIRDPLCGFKGYRTSLYRDAGCFDICNSTGTQLTLFAGKDRKRYRIQQLPIAIHPRGDHARFGGRLKANYRIFKALIKVLTS